LEMTIAGFCAPDVQKACRHAFFSLMALVCIQALAVKKEGEAGHR
jgi:hypothetical protein